MIFQVSIVFRILYTSTVTIWIQDTQNPNLSEYWRTIYHLVFQWSEHFNIQHRGPVYGLFVFFLILFFEQWLKNWTTVSSIWIVNWLSTGFSVVSGIQMPGNSEHSTVWRELVCYSDCGCNQIKIFKPFSYRLLLIVNKL